MRWWRQAPGTEGRSWEEPQADQENRLRYPTHGHYGGPGRLRRDAGRAALHARARLPAGVPGHRDPVPGAHADRALRLPDRRDRAARGPGGPDLPGRVQGPGRRPRGGLRPRRGREAGRRPAGGVGRAGVRRRRTGAAAPRRCRCSCGSGRGRAGTTADLLDISAGMDRELVGAKDPLGHHDRRPAVVDRVAPAASAAAEEALERTADVVMSPYIAAVRDLNDQGRAIPAWAVAWRAHGSTFWMEEREDTVILRGRPLGACPPHVVAMPTSRPSSASPRAACTTRPSAAYDAPSSFHLMREPRGLHARQGRLPDLRLPLPHAARDLSRSTSSGIRCGSRSTTWPTLTAR